MCTHCTRLVCEYNSLTAIEAEQHGPLIVITGNGIRATCCRIARVQTRAFSGRAPIIVYVSCLCSACQRVSVVHVVTVLLVPPCKHRVRRRRDARAPPNHASLRFESAHGHFNQPDTRSIELNRTQSINSYSVARA